MKKLITILMLALFVAGSADVQAQGYLKKLAERAKQRLKEKAKEKAEQKVDETVDNTVEGAFEGAENELKGLGKKIKVDSKEKNAEEQEQEGGTDDYAGKKAPKSQSLEMTYAKSDFVPGDEIIFDDDVTREQIGEFPSQWDLKKGTVEIAQINSDKVILCVSQDDPIIAPLFDDMKNYLPEKFTLEFDFWVGTYEKKENDNPSNQYHVYFYKPGSSSKIQDIRIDDWYYNASDHRSQLNWWFMSISEESRNGQDESFRTNPNSWNHFALSFNQRAMKIYINGMRYANIPNTIAPGHFDIQFYRSGGYYTNHSSIRNVRIAKGAVPLYDRMMSDGKFITYGITFDVGKSTIKPESMGEINRIVQLMTDNPDLCFSVEGHTDSTGNADSNQTLSEARSQAIVAKLTELGIAADRLTASGKGQTSPIADNGTDEGRAKNRRVEFVKQ